MTDNAIVLRTIQQKLKAPKGQFNAFAKFYYRSVEDILEALKPLLIESELTLTLTDRVEERASAAYVVATATIYANGGSPPITTEGWAREATTKKGMDDAQITGSCSSYARKYALNGMFLIDDSKLEPVSEPDSYDKQPQPEPPPIEPPTPPPPTTPAKENVYKQYMTAISGYKKRIISLDAGDDKQYYAILAKLGMKKANDAKGTGAMDKMGRPACAGLREYIAIREKEIEEAN